MSENEIMSEAQKLVTEISQIKTQAEEHLKAAEVARKNANSEGLFAINAKKTCEEHATSISQLKGTTESEAKAITANKQKSDELLAAVNAAKATLDAEAKTVGEYRKEAELVLRAIQDSSGTSKSRVQEIDKLKTTAEESQKATSESLAECNKILNDMKAAKEKTLLRLEAVNKTEATIVAVCETATAQAGDIASFLADAREKETALKKVLDHINNSDSISVKHELRVEELTKQLEDLMERVVSLLPGATSVGLASSFNKQIVRFTKSQKLWFRTFITCIILLFVLAIPSFLATFGVSSILGMSFGHASDPKWEDIMRGLLLRLPIIIPLVWLAIYAGRNYMLSLRLEEEYAYKAAVSTAFEGYKRELANIPADDSGNPAPLNKLCGNILAAIAERPGRIYEGKQHDITPFNESCGAATDIASIANKKIQGDV
ncbi:MAG: hypothetical protein WC637_02695 [Victivallales bacterium]|jgi:hypothetical protein